jgi:chromosome segregation ATPase
MLPEPVPVDVPQEPPPPQPDWELDSADVSEAEEGRADYARAAPARTLAFARRDRYHGQLQQLRRRLQRLRQRRDDLLATLDDFDAPQQAHLAAIERRMRELQAAIAQLLEDLERL